MNVDFFSKETYLAIEIDGSTHSFEGQPEKDLVRQQRLESLGVLFLRFDDLDIKTDMKWVVNEIHHWINTHPRPLQGGE